MNVKLAIIAASAAAATVLPAQTTLQVGAATNVTISGLFTAGIKNSEVTDSSRPGLSNEWRIDDNTSRLIFSSTTKVADGWSVVFRLENRFTADVRPSSVGVFGTTTNTGTITGWADGDTWGGVGTPIGTFVFGKSSLYWGDGLGLDYLGAPGIGESVRIWDVQGLTLFNMLDQAQLVTKTGVAAASAYTLSNTREQNVLRFDSVRFHNFDLALAFTKNDGGDENHYVAPGTAGYARPYEDGGTFYARLRYFNGGFNASASVVNKTIQGGVYAPATTAGPLDLHAYRLGAAYTLPMGLRFGFVYDKTEYDNGVLTTRTDAKRTDWEIPINYLWGKHEVAFTYNKAGDTSGFANTGANMINLVYDYALTKRAFIGVFYSKISNDANGHYSPFLSGTSLGPTGVAVAGEGFRQIGINMNYWF